MTSPIKIPDGALTISATRKEMFDRCARLWWLKEGGPLKLTEPDRGYLTFGTALHAVIERYLTADELEGDLELYPPLWDVELANGEAALIKELIAKAINDGVIARIPGQLVEHTFEREIVPGQVYIHSTIDLLTEEGITDHKTTKNMRYAKSAKELARTPQMLIYAMEFLQRKTERGEVWPDKIELRHNVFCKNPDDKRIRVTKAYVTPDQVVEYWQGVLTGSIPEMLLVQQLTRWQDVPAAISLQPENCNAFGGCHFKDLCLQHRTIEQYISDQNQPRVAPKCLAQPPTGGYPQMGSILDRMTALKGKTTAAQVNPAPIIATPAPQAAPVLQAPLPTRQQAKAIKEIKETPALAPDPVVTDNAPPWAIPTCPACKGYGFNSVSSEPCRICDQTRKQNRWIESRMFNIEIGEGTIAWQVKPEFVAFCAERNYEEQEQGEAEEMAERTTEQVVTGAGPVVVQTMPEPMAIAVAGPPAQNAPVVEKRGPGRPRKDGLPPTQRATLANRGTYVMFLGCRPSDGIEKQVLMEQLMLDVGDEIAAASNQKNFFVWDIWQRRDYLMQNLPAIMARAAGTAIYVSIRTKENEQLVDALVARAKDAYVADGFYMRGSV